MSNLLTVRDIVKEYLCAHGYDGLFDVKTPNRLCACGCLIDNLFPCENWGANCVPAYKIQCVPRDDCPPECFGDCIGIGVNLCMTPTKPRGNE